MTSPPVDPDKTVGVLVMSHGTPRSLDELPAFYTEIRRGHSPTPELLADLERRYLAIGGASPESRDFSRCFDRDGSSQSLAPNSATPESRQRWPSSTKPARAAPSG